MMNRAFLLDDPTDGYFLYIGSCRIALSGKIPSYLLNFHGMGPIAGQDSSAWAMLVSAYMWLLADAMDAIMTSWRAWLVDDGVGDPAAASARLGLPGQ